MEQTYYAVLDIHKYHSPSSLLAQEKHNNREYKMNHVDDSLSCFNRNIVDTGGLSYTERWTELKKMAEIRFGHTIKKKSNSVIAYDIVTAMTPGAEKALEINIDEWCEENKRFMEDTFGKDNIIVMTLHMDENDNLDDKGPRGTHIHTLIIPIDERGHLCARSFTGSRTIMKNLHTKYHEGYMSKFGLERGEPNSKLKHSNRKRWYSDVDKICNLQAPRIKDGETMEAYLERLDKEWQDMHLKIANEKERADKRIAKSETRQAQIFGEYAYSINLQHILEEEYEGDMTKVNERLKNYQIMEKSIPRIKLDNLIKAAKVKYPPEQSIANYRMGKKKKHKKWESLPDIEETSTSTTTDSKYDNFVDNKVEDNKTSNEIVTKTSSLLDETNQRKYQEKYDKFSDKDELSNEFGEKLEN